VFDRSALGAADIKHTYCMKEEKEEEEEN